VQRFLRNGEKYYIFIVDNSLLFPTVKNYFQNRLTVDEVVAKSSTQRFFETPCSICDVVNGNALTTVYYY